MSDLCGYVAGLRERLVGARYEDVLVALGEGGEPVLWWVFKGTAGDLIYVPGGLPAGAANEESSREQ